MALSFVAAVRPSEVDMRQRFGPPAFTQAVVGGAQVLRGPTIGMAAPVGAASRGVLQTVALCDFEGRLTASAASAALAAIKLFISQQKRLEFVA